MNGQILAELVKIREILEARMLPHEQGKFDYLRRFWMVIFEAVAFIAAVVSIIIYFIDYLAR